LTVTVAVFKINTVTFIKNGPFLMRRNCRYGRKSTVGRFDTRSEL